MILCIAVAAHSLLAFGPPPRATQQRAETALPLATGRRQVLSLGSALLLSSVAGVQASVAEDAPMTKAECRASCNTECNTVAPGNKDYCAAQCEDFCDNLDPTAVGSPASEKQAPAKDCSGYKSAEAKAYCAKENEKALALARPASKDLGIFGDSGVSYSKGVEDLFATAFGAKQQNKNVKEADIGGFASDVGTAAVKVLTGGN